MAEMVGSAVVQEAVSRVSSFVFGKHEDKAHEEHGIERLEMALSELEFALERSAKVPITDVSLLRRRQVFKHAYVEAMNLINKHKQRKLQEDRHVTRARNLSISSLVGLNKDKSLRLSCSHVRRFEWFADCARKFVRDVESGCSLRHYTFCNPLVRYLFEGKTLEYEIVQGSQLRCFHIWPIIFEERGVEAELAYRYDYRKMPYNSFQLRLMLRLSESTDISGIAIKCLQSLSSQLVTKSAIGEITLLHGLLQDMSHKYAPPRVGIQESHTQDTVFFRPDPTCCKSSRQEPCASNITSSELLSHIFPEQVIFIAFQCFVSGQEYNLCVTSSSNEEGRNVSRDCRQFMELTACVAPHYFGGEGLELQLSCANELITSTSEHKIGSIQQVEEMVRSKAARQLVLTDYSVLWLSTHGSAYYRVRNPSAEVARVQEPNGRSKTRRSAKRRR